MIAFPALGYRGVWYPTGDKHRIPYRLVSCFGAISNPASSKHTFLTSITVDEMAQAVDSVLSPRTEDISNAANAGFQL